MNRLRYDCPLSVYDCPLPGQHTLRWRACPQCLCTECLHRPPPFAGVFCSLVINFLINQGAYAPVFGARPMMKARPTGSIGMPCFALRPLGW
jgi:hypothetical protein